MGLNYSQKRLLSVHKKGSTSPRKPRARHLEMYAFWTGLASTFISLVQVVIMAIKK